MEKGAGVGSGFSDNEYVDAGASLSIMLLMFGIWSI
jgi:alanine dehydrogenase